MVDKTGFKTIADIDDFKRGMAEYQRGLVKMSNTDMPVLSEDSDPLVRVPYDPGLARGDTVGGVRLFPGITDFIEFIPQDTVDFWEPGGDSGQPFGLHRVTHRA